MPNEFKVKNGLLVSGSANINSSGSGIFTVDGISGRLFAIEDTLSGSLFSVNTAAGLPIIEAFSDNTVRIGQYGQQVLFVSQSRVGIGKETGLNGTLDVSGSVTITGSVVATSFTGSLLGTASFATSASQAITSSYVLQAVSASIASTASSADNFTVRNTLTAQTIVVQTITSSIDFVTGSSRFGSLITNAHQFTGSVGMTGSLTVIGPVSASSFTGSILGTAATASFVTTAQTASFVLTAQTASYILQAVSASFATLSQTANTASFVTTAQTASFVLNAQTASFVTTAQTASYVLNAVSASNANLLDGLDSTVFATTGSNTFRGTEVISGSLIVTGSTILTGSLLLSGSITVNTNGDSRVFASTFRPTGATGQNLYIGHAGTTNVFNSGNDAFGNTSVGVFALDSNTTGYGNTAVGRASLDLNRVGNENTAVGYNAGNANFSGSNNVAIGSQTFNSYDGFNGVAIGALAGSNINSSLVTGSIYIGYNALGSNGALNAVINNEIVIGSNNTGLGSNTVVLGNSSITTTVLRGRVGIGTTAPTVALEISAGSIKAGTNSSTEGTVILQDSYTAGNLTNFGTNRSGGGAVISYASIPSPVTSSQFVSTFSSAAARSAIIIQDNISFYTTGAQTIASGSAVIMSERVRITDTGQLAFYRYTSTSSFPGTVAAVLAVDSSGNVITTAASGSAGGGGGTPGGANTTIQFNDSNTFSGSGAFTFTKATNTVRIQASGSALLVISGSQGELLRVQDSGSSPNILAAISSGSTNVFIFTTSSLAVTGSVTANIETDAIYYGRIVVTPSTNQNDYSPTGWNDADPNKATTINITAGASIKITGLAGGTAGRMAILKNTSADRLIILEDQSTSSTAANRFDFRNPIFLLPNGSVTLLYDGVSSRWEPLATSGGIGFGAFFNEYEDFFGAATSVSAGTATEVGSFSVVANGTGASGQAGTYLVNTTEKPLGVYQIDTGTTATGRAQIGSTDIASVIPANGTAICLSRLAVENLSTTAEGYQAYFGWQDGANTGSVAPITDGVYWQYNSASSTAWQGATANNNTRTTTGAAGPTVDTNYIWLGIFVDSTWARATYFYSQDSVTWTIAGEITTNLPTAARSTGFGALINKTAGTTARNLSIDLMAHRYDISRG